MAKTTTPEPKKITKISAPKPATKKVEPKKTAPKVVAPKPTTKKPEIKKVETKTTCSSVARDLIIAGKTNAEVWAVIKSKFNLDDKKKGYPAWYRMDLKRRGVKVPA